ncbi:MAG: class I SAM-dependent DNA methyltransferase [Selenomonadaceae bacterium]|nr:class I SAM-dependent DNA methyltransferase [Selenomonadaceae bacterium]
MNDVKKFIAQWSGRGYEKGETHSFWLSFLRDVLGVSEPEKFIRFEVPVKLKHTSFIDAFLPDTKVIIEQKSISEDITQGKSQSDGSTLTPYEQAQRYGSSLPYSMRPRWIVVCNFAEFLIYDMETLEPPIKILLEELPSKYHLLDFLIDENKNKLRVELELSLKAGEIVGKLYDALHSQYINPNNENSLASLNKLCVRLVFCLYAESAGIFGKHKIFRDWLQGSRNIRQDLILLFDTLNTPIDKRDPYLDDTLKKFPYVNGGLFAGAIEIPNFTPEIKTLLLEEASSGFNWAGISPTIFGAVFESTINPATRRAGGMHYTSVENIHKVIDPLFLDDLKAQLTKFSIADFVNRGSKRKNFLLQLQNKLAEIKIFDPACGSGNFLTESYISLRRIENQILKSLFGSQIQLGELSNPIKVSISQFYGIEINDFAVAVAQTALWIAELQMIQETQAIIHHDLDFLPLKSYSNIVEGNSLHLDWQNICPQPNFIIGNPPFVGFTYQSAAQKADMQNIFPKVKNLDYVAGWFKKAADFMRNSTCRAAFVATNSITQGETVTRLWKNLFAAGNHIDFAHRTFIWNSESTQKAHVHCVIVGFSSAHNIKPKIIFDGDKKISAANINAYLLDAPDIFVDSRPNHIQDFVTQMNKGSTPIDGGNFLFKPEELTEFLKREPAAEKYIRQILGADEFINGKLRYCLWLVDCSPKELKSMPLVYERVKNVRDVRLASKRAATRKLADNPTRFAEIRQPTTNYLLVPCVSSERRRYVPIGFMTPDIIVSDLVLVIPKATKYEFGVLTSSLHMTWLRTVGGRLKSDYRYSKDVVYNNFIWVEPTDNQKNAIEASAQLILDIRAKFPDSSLAELYDEITMPYELREAHKKNDLAVAKAYGLENILDDEPKIAVELLKRYEALTKS